MSLTDYAIAEVGTGFQKDTMSPIGEALNIDSTGKIGVIFTSDNLDFSVYNPYFAIWDGSAWTVETINIESTPGYHAATYDNNLFVDSSDNWHFAWFQKHAGSATYTQLRYSKRTSGTWGTVENIGVTPTSSPSGEGNAGAFISMNSSNNVLVAYRGNAAGTYYTVAKYNGATWTNYASTYNSACYNSFKIGDAIFLTGQASTKKFDSTTNTWSDTTSNTGFGRYGALDLGSNEMIGITSAITAPFASMQFAILDTSNPNVASVVKYINNLYGFYNGSCFIPQHTDNTHVYFIAAGNYINPIVLFKYR